jgi:hypothetical protein
LHSKFVKSDNITQKMFSQKSDMGIKNAEIDADFESAERRKNYRKMEFFDFFIECRGFWVNFLTLFSADSISALHFAFCDNHIKFFYKKFVFLILALLGNFKAKIGRNTSKNQNHML